MGFKNAVWDLLKNPHGQILTTSLEDGVISAKGNKPKIGWYGPLNCHLYACLGKPRLNLENEYILYFFNVLFFSQQYILEKCKSASDLIEISAFIWQFNKV